MRRFVTILTAVLLTGFQTPPQVLPPQLAALAEDVQAARTFDYMALKATGADLKALSSAVSMRHRLEGEPQRALTAAETIMQTELAAAAEAPTAEIYQADRAAADAAWDRWIAFGESVMAGQPVADPPFSHVAERVREMETATDPRVRDLLRRAARDQLLRRGWEAGDEVWLEAPTPGALSRFNNRLGRQVWATDSDNTEWLKADVAAHGWYRIPVHGEAASSAAWLMTQHADRDPTFQREVLALMEPLLAAGEIRAANYAYLYDRIAMNAEKPQRYGTQGHCTAPNVWSPFPLENEDDVERLRESVEIGSLAEYRTHMSRYCADFTG